MVNVAEIPAAIGAGRTCSKAATGGMSISSLVQERLLTHAAASVSGREQSRPLRQAVRANSDTQTVTLLDYGAGNVRSVRNAIKTLGYNLIDVRPSSQLQTALKYHQHSCFMSQSRQWHVTSRSPDAQVKSPSDITNASKIIFPGVGAYAQAMKRLEDMDYVNALKEYIQVSHSLQRKLFRTMCSVGPNTRRIQLGTNCPAQQGKFAQILKPTYGLQSGKPFLGICLGLQLLFEGSTENGGVEGLGIVPGQVTVFDRSLGLPVPHIGWNDLHQR